MIQLDYHAAYYAIEDGWYMAKLLDFPGVLTQGRTLEKARGMLRSALRDMVEWEIKDGRPLPRPDPNATDPSATALELMKLILQQKIETPNVAPKAASTPS
jgi:predicted RNase H-like HicB family nuclease